MSDLKISVIEGSNILASKMDAADKEIDSLISSIHDMTADLNNPQVSNHTKYESIVSIEFLLVRARILTEFEHLKVKQVLSKNQVEAYLKAIFIKRDQYLAQVSLKLNAIRDDIEILQKVVYTQSTRNLR